MNKYEAAAADTPVATVDHLVRRFSRKTALDGVNLEVPQGKVFGLVGENGAGKSTMIKILLGLIRPTSGSVRVFGLDPIAEPVAVLSRIGYLSEDRDLPDWMRLEELLAYTRSFYPAWDDTYAEALREWFGLDLQARVGTLSRGERAKAGLLVALAYRPELLLLDEPSSGLDPAARHDLLETLLRDVVGEGRSVLFSSHLLDEIERVSDIVAMIHHGKVVLCGPLEDIRAAHNSVTVHFDREQARPPEVQGLIGATGYGREWMIVTDGTPLEALRDRLTPIGAQIVETRVPTLEEIFIARVHQGRKPATV